MTSTSSDQIAFIANIRKALGHTAADAPDRRATIFDRAVGNESGTLLDVIRQRSHDDRRLLLARFSEQARPLNLNVTPVPDSAAAADAIVDLVAATTPEWGDRKSVIRWPDPLLDDLDLETRLATQGIPVHTTRLDPKAPVDKQRAVIRRQTIDAYIGVTTADFCLADTATLVMKSRPHQARSVSLVPSIHVAVVRLDRMLADLKELYALLRWDDTQWREGLTHHMVMISGPSKTADIELVMVHGAHGPRAVHVVVITGRQ